MSVTGNSGLVMPSWFVWSSPPRFRCISIFSRFDCYSFDIPNRAEDEEGLYRAVNWINKLISIEETEHNIPPKRIIIGGLSQGGAVSLLITITTKKPLADLFALSTYVPLRRKTSEVAITIPFNLKSIDFFQRYSPHSRNRYPYFGVTERWTDRSITNFPSSALRLLHPTSKYASNPTKTLLWLAKNLKKIHLKDWSSTRMEIWVIGSINRNS